MSCVLTLHPLACRMLWGFIYYILLESENLVSGYYYVKTIRKLRVGIYYVRTDLLRKYLGFTNPLGVEYIKISECVRDFQLLGSCLNCC